MTTSNDNEVATPRVDELDYNQKIKSYRIWDLARELEREVARLRELLDRAIEMAEEAIRLADIDYENDKFGKVTWLKKEVAEIEAESRLAPAPEETQDGATMDEWYGGFSKIESTEPAPEPLPKQEEWDEDAYQRRHQNFE